MTTPVIPEFILQLFSDEIRKILELAVDAIVESTGNDKAAIMKLLEGKRILAPRVVKHEEEVFRIVRQKPRNKLPEDEHRCQARVCKQHIFQQCAFSKKEGDFCKRHHKHLKHGTVNDPLPEDRSSKAVTKIW